MEPRTKRATPLLVGYARSAPTAGVAYVYDEARGVNVVAGVEPSPAVQHPAGVMLVKTVQVQEGEDQVPPDR